MLILTKIALILLFIGSFILCSNQSAHWDQTVRVWGDHVANGDILMGLLKSAPLYTVLALVAAWFSLAATTLFLWLARMRPTAKLLWIPVLIGFLLTCWLQVTVLKLAKDAAQRATNLQPTEQATAAQLAPLKGPIAANHLLVYGLDYDDPEPKALAQSMASLFWWVGRLFLLLAIAVLLLGRKAKAPPAQP